MIALLDCSGGLSAWFWALPRAAMLGIYGLLLAYTIGAGGFTLARSGFKPLWVLLLLVPTVNVMALWCWACGRWPNRLHKR